MERGQVDAVRRLPPSDLLRVVRDLWEARGYRTTVRRGDDAVYVPYRRPDTTGADGVVLVSEGAVSPERLRAFLSTVEEVGCTEGAVVAIGGVDTTDDPEHVELLDAAALAAALQRQGVPVPGASNAAQSGQDSGPGAAPPPKQGGGRGPESPPQQTAGGSPESPPTTTAGGGPESPPPSGGQNPPSAPAPESGAGPLDSLPGNTWSRLAAVAAVVLAVAALGVVQLGVLEGDDATVTGQESTAVASGVPGGVDFVALADGDVASDGQTAEILRRGLRAGGPSIPFGSLDGGVAYVRETYGIDLDATRRVLVFGRATGGDEEYAAVAVTVDPAHPSLERVAERTTGGAYEPTTYGETTVYRSTNGTLWFAQAAEDTYLVGTPGAVRDAIDVRRGAAPTWSGTFRDRFRGTRSGLIRFVYRTPNGSDARIAAVAGSYRTGQRVGVSATFYATNRTAAADLEGQIGEIIARGAEGGAASRLLGNAEVGRQGSTVEFSTDGPARGYGAILGGVLINSAGFLQTQAEATGQQASQQLSRVEATEVVGRVGPDGATVTRVNVTVRQPPGTPIYDLANATVELSSAPGTRWVSSSADAAAPATFTVVPIRDDDGSLPVLNDTNDRAVLSVPLSDATALHPGAEATLVLRAADGTEHNVTVQVPESLPGSGSALAL
ncbi:MAG: hypothetical protein ABEJ89_09235 [Haloarculaceae archaeon]